MRKFLSLLLCLALICGFAAIGHAEEKIVITMLDHYTDEQADIGNAEAVLYRDAFKMLEEKYPDVEFQREIIAHDVYETKIKTLAAANELPDIFAALPTFAKSFYNNGQIHDLRPLISADEEWWNSYVDGAFGDFEYGDVILCAPRVAIYNTLLLYNEEIFKECGYETFPATMEELEAAIQVIKEKGYIPMACGNKPQYSLSSQNMPGLLFKFCGADWYSEVRNYGDASFTDEAPVAAINYMYKLIQNGLFNEDFNALEQSQSRQYYYDGKAAMYIEGSWIISTFISETTDEVLNKTNITNWPALESKPEYAGQIVGGQGWGVSVSSKLEGEKLAIALDFLKFLADPALQGAAVEAGQVSVIKAPVYDASKLHPFYSEFLDSVAVYDTVVGCPEVQLSAEYMDASYVGYQEMSIGAITPEELAQSMQDAHEMAQ